tara:strand:+ start:3025 stop:3723 length:699 start_codon:yes stop_codon:yes gene_type:complete
MKKGALFLLLFCLPGIALANNATDGSNVAIFISNIFSLLLTISLGLSLVFFTLVALFFIKGLVDPQYSNKTGRTPVSTMGLFSGIILASLFASPLLLVDFVGNISGLTSSFGAPLCVAPNVSDLTVGYGWVNSAANCLETMESNFASLLNYSGTEALDVANLDIFIMGIQTVSLMSMLYGFYIIMMHILGFRDVRIGKMMAFIMIVVASTVFALPNLAVYIDDAREASQQVL